MLPIEEAADLKPKKFYRKRFESALTARSRRSMVFYDGELRQNSERDQRLSKRFGKRTAEKYPDQVTLVIGAAFEIVDGIGGLCQRFGCVTQLSFDL